MFTQISYLCFTYEGLEENLDKHFNLEQFLTFFFNPQFHDMFRQGPKASGEPYAQIPLQSIICSDKNFKDVTEQETNALKTIWEKYYDLYPKTISRFVIKLDIPESEARAYYEAQNFSQMANHIIGKRADTITADEQHDVTQATWTVGHFSFVEKSAYDIQHSSCHII